MTRFRGRNIALLFLVAQLALGANVACSDAASAGSGKVLKQAGDRRTCNAPASTCEMPFAAMRFDAVSLSYEKSPSIAFRTTFRDGDDAAPKWPPDSARWIEYSDEPRAWKIKAQSWAEEKCDRYRSAWTEMVNRRGTQSLGQEFVSTHEAFLASGCSTSPDVCPRSPAELDVANMMVLAALNAGIPSTFLPFACRTR